MNLTKQLIIEKCGTVSFKRGEAFYKANKVDLITNSSSEFEAIVKGNDDFHVSIIMSEHDIHCSCSCPTLHSYTKDCQHSAAVLLAILDEKKKNKQKAITPKQMNSSEHELIDLFSKSSLPKSRQMNHFEKRQTLQIDIICELIEVHHHQFIPTISLMYGHTSIHDIKSFLNAIDEKQTFAFTNTFHYNPLTHCFTFQQDAILQICRRIAKNDVQELKDIPASHLAIPPIAWTDLFPLLENAADCQLKINEEIFPSIESKDLLPLRFSIQQEKDLFQCKVNGLQRLFLLKDYCLAIMDGYLYSLSDQDSKRLFEIQRMLLLSQSDTIPISHSQLELFLERVVPGLRKLGTVELPKNITSSLASHPLIIQLFLDRIRNSLLAGVEFHYGDIVIDPFKEQAKLDVLLIRDEEKEAMVLELIEESGFSKTEGGYNLQNEELEYDFLTNVLPKLQKLTKVFATTAVRNRIFRAPSKPRISVRLKKERVNWLEFTFEQDGIPDFEIKQLLQALEEKRKYYRLRDGSLFSLDSREYDEIRRFLQAVPLQEEEWEMPVVKGLQHLALETDLFEYEASFKAFLNSIQNPENNEFDIPESLAGTLYPYQIQGFKWLKTLKEHHFGGILADDMGLGKTLQAIAFLVSEQCSIQEQKKPALIVCPTAVTYNWLGELMKFAPELNALVADGSKIERQRIYMQASNLDIIITSYPMLRQDIGWYKKQTFHTVFFDEAQAFKNPITQTAKAVKQIQADHAFALTGTPIENSSEELWSIFHVVFPELFMSLKDFSNLTRKQMIKRSRPFILRRMKEDVLAQLPLKKEELDIVDLLPEQKKLYTAYLAKLRNDTLKHLNQATLRKNKIRILAGLTRLRQICCHPSLFVEGYNGSSAKLNKLLEIVEDAVASERRVLIFSQFTQMLQLIKRELAARGYEYLYLDGQTSSEERVNMCEAFNTGEKTFFLISLKAGGTGLNLTGADTVVLYDLWWNPAVEEQATDRAHRLGQKKDVQVIKLVARGTIEEKMNELQERKRKLIEEIIDSKDESSTLLTEEDIRDLLNIH